MQGKKQRGVAPFIFKLFKLLSNPQFSGYVDWTSDPNTFVIKNVTQFSQVVLPFYYKHSNFSSFVRQLNIYGFSKTKIDSTEHVYYNPNFDQRYRSKLKFIKRRAYISKGPGQIVDSEVDGQSSVKPFLGDNHQELPKLQSTQAQDVLDKIKQKLRAAEQRRHQNIQNSANLIFQILKNSRYDHYPSELALKKLIKNDLENSIPYQMILQKLKGQMKQCQKQKEAQIQGNKNYKQMNKQKNMGAKRIEKNQSINSINDGQFDDSLQLFDESCGYLSLDNFGNQHSSIDEQDLNL